MTLAPVSTSTPASARWYVNTNVAANVEFARANPHALTGWYGCCNLLSVNDTGAVAQKVNLTAVAHPMKAALRPSGGPELTFHAVFSVAEAAIHSSAALVAVPELVRLAAASGADGLLCDYEPADNYTDAHARAYTSFLSALVKEARAQAGAGGRALEVGVDVAGWGILDNWEVLAALDADFYTSMSPTYSGKDVARDRAFATDYVHAVGTSRAAIGVGSMPALGFEPHCANMPDYGWNQSSFTAFAAWLKGAAGVSKIDVWRCDIDHYGETAAWFIDAIEAFLADGRSAEAYK